MPKTRQVTDRAETKSMAILGTAPASVTADVFAGDAGQGEQRLAQIGFRIEF